MNPYLNFSLEGKVALVTGAMVSVLLSLQLLQSKEQLSVSTISTRSW